MEGDRIMHDKDYADNLRMKRIKKGGGLPPLIKGVSKEKQDEIQMALDEEWLRGYKIAKKRYK